MIGPGSPASGLRGLVLLLPVLGLAGGTAGGAGSSLRPTTRVLLVGNSLTHGNRLPEMVTALAEAAGLDWEVHSVLRMGASLQDQVHDGILLPLLAGQRWDFVVLQQGPSTLPASRAQLRESTRNLAPRIRAAGARPALFMVWPDSIWSAARFTADYERIRDGYALAAQDVSGLFIPAGEAWREILRQASGIRLYGPDGFHPAPAGSYLAALIIVGQLGEVPLQGLPHRLVAADGTIMLDLGSRESEVLQHAATRVLKQFRHYRPADRP